MTNSALDLIKQPLVMFNLETRDICIIYKFDNNWGSGQLITTKDCTECKEFYLDDLVLYNGSLEKWQYEILMNINLSKEIK